MVLVALPALGERAVVVDVEGGHHAVAAVEADHDPPVGRRRAGGLATSPPGRPHTSVRVTPPVARSTRTTCSGAVEIPMAAERAVVALGALAVVEEPGGPSGDHRVPAVGLAGERAVAAREVVVERQRSRRPSARGSRLVSPTT